MTPKVRAVDPDRTLSDLERLSGAPVVGADGELVGGASRADVLRALRQERDGTAALGDPYQVHAAGTSVARKHADRVPIELSIDDRTSAEGEIVRGLEHVRDLRVGAPSERLVHPGPRQAPRGPRRAEGG